MPGNLNVVHGAITRRCSQAEKAWAESGDPERAPNRFRNFIVVAEHYWHGCVTRLVQANASREAIAESFANPKGEVGDASAVKLMECEEIVRFKLASPEEREGLTKLIEFAREEGLTDNYALEQAVKLLERCRLGYDL